MENTSCIANPKDLQLYWMNEIEETHERENTFENICWSWDPKEEGIGVFEYLLQFDEEGRLQSQLLNHLSSTNKQKFQTKQFWKLDDDVSSLSSSQSEALFGEALSPLTDELSLSVDKQNGKDEMTLTCDEKYNAPANNGSEDNLKDSNSSEIEKCYVTVSWSNVSPDPESSFIDTNADPVFDGNSRHLNSSFNLKDTDGSMLYVENGNMDAGRHITTMGSNIAPNVSYSWYSDTNKLHGSPITGPGVEQDTKLPNLMQPLNVESPARMIADSSVDAISSRVYRDSVTSINDAASTSSRRVVYMSMNSLEGMQPLAPLPDIRNKSPIPMGGMNERKQKDNTSTSRIEGSIVAACRMDEENVTFETPSASSFTPTYPPPPNFLSGHISFPTPYYGEMSIPESMSSPEGFVDMNYSREMTTPGSASVHNASTTDPTVPKVTKEEYRLACGCVVREGFGRSGHCTVCADGSPKVYMGSKEGDTLDRPCNNRKRCCSYQYARYLDKGTKRFGECLRRNGRKSYGSDEETGGTLKNEFTNKHSAVKKSTDSEYYLETLSDGDWESHVYKRRRLDDHSSLHGDTDVDTPMKTPKKGVSPRVRTLSSWIQAPVGLSPFSNAGDALHFFSHSTINEVPERHSHDGIGYENQVDKSDEKKIGNEYNKQIICLLVEFYNIMCNRIVSVEDPTFPEVYRKVKAICDRHFKESEDADLYFSERCDEDGNSLWYTREARSLIFDKLMDYSFGELYPIGIPYVPRSTSDASNTVEAKLAVMDRSNWGRTAEFYRDSAGGGSMISYDSNHEEEQTRGGAAATAEQDAYTAALPTEKDLEEYMRTHDDKRLALMEVPPTNRYSVEDAPFDEPYTSTTPISHDYDEQLEHTLGNHLPIETERELDGGISTPIPSNHPSQHAAIMERTAVLSVSHGCQTEFEPLPMEHIGSVRTARKSALSIRNTRPKNVKTEFVTTHMELSPIKEQQRRYPQRNRCRPLKWYIGERQEYQMNAELGVAEVVAIKECLNADKVLQHLIGAYRPKKRKAVKPVYGERGLYEVVSKQKSDMVSDALSSRMYSFFVDRKPKYAFASQLRNSDGTFYRYKSVYEQSQLVWNLVASGAARQTEILVALNARTSQVKVCNMKIPSGHHKEIDSTRDHIFYGYVLEGEDLLVTIGDESISVKKGDAFVIPQHTEWSLKNTSRDSSDAEIWLNLVQL